MTINLTRSTYSRSFRSVGDQLFLQAFEDATLPFEDWTHEAHLRMAWNYIKQYGAEGAEPYIKSVLTVTVIVDFLLSF